MSPDVFVSSTDRPSASATLPATDTVSSGPAQSVPTNNPSSTDPAAYEPKYRPSSPSQLHKNPREYSEVIAGAKPTKRNWSSFMLLPDRICFDTQTKDEQILLFLRQHPIVNVPWILIAIVMIVGPLLVLPLMPFYTLLPVIYKLMGLFAWYLFTAGFVIEHILMWLFNAFIITDERIIDVDFYSIIFKEVNFAQISKIQDVSTRTGGVLFSLIDVGDVFIQTAGEVPEFVFDNISHPARVVKLLNELTQEEEQEIEQPRANLLAGE